MLSQDRFPFRVLGGRYLVTSLVGVGATGRVYRATQLAVGRTVAIKLLKPAFARHPEMSARFRFEARAASLLDHPGIIQVLDWGEEPDGAFCLVVEYLRGRDLFEVASRCAPMPAARIAALMRQVGGALAHAHQRGVIHRDLKPENLRVIGAGSPDAAEVVKIYDFGTARIAGDGPPGVDETGTMVGTPDYMSPEQAAASAVGPACDLYACGVIMFFLATGRLPFVGKTAVDVALLHLTARPPRPSLLRPDIDPRLETIILRCLAKRPADRPSDADELRALLASIGKAPPPPSLPRAAEPTRARRAQPRGVLSRAGAVSLAALLSLGSSPTPAGPRPPRPSVSVSQASAAMAACRRADPARPCHAGGEALPDAPENGPREGRQEGANGREVRQSSSSRTNLRDQP